jgi:nitroreductase
MLNPEQFHELAAARRSTRDFTSEPIDGSVLDEILNEGVTAPSWSNTRPFMVAVATGEQRDRISNALVKRLRESAEMPGQGASPDYTHVIPYPEGLIERSQRVGKGIYDTLEIDRTDKAARFKFLERNYEFFGAPAALFFFAHRGLDHFGTLDLGLYMQTVMLAAKARGIGTCAQGYLGNYPDIIRQEFDVSDDYALVCGMSIGYPSDHPINGWQAERLPIDELKVPARK